MVCFYDDFVFKYLVLLFIDERWCVWSMTELKKILNIFFRRRIIIITFATTTALISLFVFVNLKLLFISSLK